MKKLGITVLVIVVLLVAAALIIRHVISINQYHAQIRDRLQKKLGRTVTLGQMSLSLFPPSVQVQNPVIGEDPRFTQNEDRPFASAEKLSVSVKFWPLLHKDVQVKSLELVRPHIEMVRNQQGMWNFASLGQPANAPAATEQPESGQTPPNAPQNPATKAPHKKNAPVGKAKPEPKVAATPQPQTAGNQQPSPEKKSAASEFSLANLQITDGQVAITDQQKHQSRAVYDHIDVTVNDFAPNKPFSL